MIPSETKHQVYTFLIVCVKCFQNFIKRALVAAEQLIFWQYDIHATSKRLSFSGIKILGRS